MFFFEDFMDFFTKYTKIIVLLHVLSAAIWMGGMITLTATMSHFIRMKPLKEDNIRIIMSSLKRFNFIVTFLILIVIVTALIMQMGFVFSQGNPILLTIVHTNEMMGGFMVAIFLYTVIKWRQAQKHYSSGNFLAAKNDLILVLDYLFPLNFFLGIIATYFGLILRGL